MLIVAKLIYCFEPKNIGYTYSRALLASPYFNYADKFIYFRLNGDLYSDVINLSNNSIGENKYNINSIQQLAKSVYKC